MRKPVNYSSKWFNSKIIHSRNFVLFKNTASPRCIYHRLVPLSDNIYRGSARCHMLTLYTFQYIKIIF